MIFCCIIQCEARFLQTLKWRDKTNIVSEENIVNCLRKFSINTARQYTKHSKKMNMGPDLQLVNNTGLKAEQNICFVNISVQLLNCIPSIQAYFKKKCYKLEMIGSKKTDICDEISDIFIPSGKRYCSAAKLRNLVALNSGRLYLSDGSHQDAIEFLMTLLQLVKSETSYQSSNIIDGLFGLERLEKNFVLGLNGKCVKCSKKPRDEVEEFSVFELEVSASHKIFFFAAIVRYKFE